jgi:hypothetical protein
VGTRGVHEYHVLHQVCVVEGQVERDEPPERIARHRYAVYSELREKRPDRVRETLDGAVGAPGHRLAEARKVERDDAARALEVLDGRGPVRDRAAKAVHQKERGSFPLVHVAHAAPVEVGVLLLLKVPGQ